MGKVSRPRPVGRKSNKQKKYYCMTVFTGTRYGNIVTDQNPIDWLHTRIRQANYNLALVLIWYTPITQEQYIKALKLSETATKIADMNKESAMKKAEKKVLDPLNKQ